MRAYVGFKISSFFLYTCIHLRMCIFVCTHIRVVLNRSQSTHYNQCKCLCDFCLGPVVPCALSRCTSQRTDCWRLVQGK